MELQLFNKNLLKETISWSKMKYRLNTLIIIQAIWQLCNNHYLSQGKEQMCINFYFMALCKMTNTIPRVILCNICNRIAINLLEHRRIWNLKWIKQWIFPKEYKVLEVGKSQEVLMIYLEDLVSIILNSKQSPCKI
jgi:hypothetical protein